MSDNFHDDSDPRDGKNDNTGKPENSCGSKDLRRLEGTLSSPSAKDIL